MAEETISLAQSTRAALPDDDDLTDEQMQELLARATDRLKANSNSSLTTKNDSPSFTFPKLQTGNLIKPYVSQKGGIASTHDARRPEDKQHKSSLGIRKVEDPVAAKRLAHEKKTATAGKQWYDLPRTDLTPELKRDLQLIKMRSILDPHRHYKKDNGKMKAPEYSQVGTIMEGPTEFFSGRIENKKRKRTIVEEVLAGEQESGRFKTKYNELQGKKTSGKKAFYKALRARKNHGVKKGGS